ncbi:hypothetical protein JCM19992_26040 [Thermostilla marina]
MPIFSISVRPNRIPYGVAIFAGALFAFATAPVVAQVQPAPQGAGTQPPAVAALADMYIELPIDESLKARASDVKRILRDGNYASVAGGQQLVQDYYNKYALPRWTHVDNRGKLAAFRRELIGSELGGARNGGQPHDDVVQLAFNTLRNFAVNAQIDPAVRFNAVLAIGELNAKEKPVGNQPPVPYQPALPVLMQLFEDANQPDVIRAAALTGLERHVALGIGDANLRDGRLIPALIATATAATPPAGRDPEVHSWFRARAINVLGMFRSPGNDGSLAAALIAVAADEAESPRVRLAACYALGNLRYAGNTNVDVAAAARAAGKTAYDLVSERVQSARTEDTKLNPKELAGFIGPPKKCLDGIGTEMAGSQEAMLSAQIAKVISAIGREIDKATAEEKPKKPSRTGPPGYPGSTYGEEYGSEYYGEEEGYPGYPGYGVPGAKPEKDPTEELLTALPPLLVQLEALIRAPAAPAAAGASTNNGSNASGT